uniref:CLOCK interacting pacemaker n=1 Tax=Pseudonaja textilis TaxID=8673 RepID=A0A670ZAZ4_PSETE
PVQLLPTTSGSVGCAAGVSGGHEGPLWPGAAPPVLSLASLASPPPLCPDRSSECLSALEQTDTGDPGSPRLPPGPDKWQEAKGGLTPLYFIQNVILEQVACSPPSPPRRCGCPGLAPPSASCPRPFRAPGCLSEGVPGRSVGRSVGGCGLPLPVGIGCRGGVRPGGHRPRDPPASDPLALLQTLGVSPTAPFLAWSNQRPLESAYSSAAHLLLFQEPTASLKPMVPSQKPSAKEIRFPTLGAYPRIAPHPGRQPEEAPSPAAEPIRHKQLYVGEAWAPPEAPTGKDSSVEKSPEGLPTSLQTAALVCPQAPARPPLPRAGRRAAVKGARRPGEHSLVRQRRLHNTVEILRRSGLLGITLRTKELLRQNSRVQRELAQLREEAQLLCQAVRNSDWQVWARLQGTTGHSAAPCLPSKGAGIETHLGQQQNLAPQPPGLDTPLPMALP